MLVMVDRVSKSFKGQQVIRDISLSIEEKEIFGLIGPSGAGKTTLIRLIIGAIGADAGKITIGDFAIPDMRALGMIGYMPQNDALYNDLSGYDNLFFFGGMYRTGRGELKKRIAEVLELVGLQTDSAKKVANYSGGMKKRLSLAIALLHRPKLLILDEPTVGIDPVLRKRIWEEFGRLRDQGTAILVTTHVMDEAVKCDRLGLIYSGAIIACDRVDTLLAGTKNHTVEELFFERGNEQ